jgi:PAS domain S-box-containing protein
MKNKISDPDILLKIADQLPTGVFVKDSDLRFLYLNDHFCKTLDRQPEELLGFSDADLWPEEESREFIESERHILETGEASIKEESLTLAAGSTLHIMSRKARMVGSDGTKYIVGNTMDLTALRKRENQYKALSETVPVGVAQIDENMNLQHANPLFNIYCGGEGSDADQKRLIGKLVEAHPVFPGENCKFEATIQGLGSQPRTVIAISSGWLDLGDGVRTATISLIDITQMSELQRINNEVTRLNKELAENMRKLSTAQDELVKKGRLEQLGQLTATIAHELRNPLGAVRTSAFLMERKLKDKGLGLEAQLERINNGVIRCDNIITQLLDFSRTKQLICEAGDIDNWLTGIVEEEARKLPANVDIELVLGLDGQTVPFDPSRLQRAIINMISNASEAMVGQGDKKLTANGAAPKITVSTYMKDGHVSIRVVDNGPGIPAEVMSRIREPLFTTKSFGTGLGVPAIEQIAVQHGGRLDIRSAVGEGSVFTVWLPQTSPVAAAEKAA